LGLLPSPTLGVSSGSPFYKAPRGQTQRPATAGGEGVVVIKAQKHRSLERNREDGLVRLRELIAAAAFVPTVRRATKPSRSSQRKRVESKVKRGQVKLQRGRVTE